MGFYCNDCGGTFENTGSEIMDDGEFWGQHVYKKQAVCPYCNSYDIEEMKRCKLCGDEYPERMMDAASIGDICEECSEILLENVSAILKDELPESQYDAACDLLAIPRIK